MFTERKQAMKFVIGRHSGSLPCDKQEAWQQRIFRCAMCVCVMEFWSLACSRKRVRYNVIIIVVVVVRLE
jgi:hypothetical protein